LKLILKKIEKKEKNKEAFILNKIKIKTLAVDFLNLIHFPKCKKNL